MTLEGPVYLSEDEPQIRKALLMDSPRWPLLTCFDRLAKDYFMNLYYEMVNEDGETDIVHDQTFQVVRLKAFFAAVTGFIMGDLDLSGRHRSRFEFLEVRLVDFITDLMSLYLLAEEDGESRSTHPGSFWCTFVEYKFKDDTKWKEFKSKWLIPDIFSFGYVLTEFVAGAGILFTNKYPSTPFQKLCLMDLPEELLDLVFRECDIQDARALSATCQRLKKIAVPYIYVSRLLGFLGPAQNHADVEEAEKGLFKESQSEFMDRLDFLFTLPDLVTRLHKVRFFDYWMGYQHREALAVPRALSLVMDVLKGCQSLTTITYDGFSVNNHFVTAMSMLPNLHTLCLLRSTFVYPPDTYDFSDPEHLPQLAHVRDLSLLLEYFGFEDRAVWNFVYFCLNVVDLSIMTRPGQVGAFPWMPIITGGPQLQSLCNLCIDGLFPTCVNPLREWFVALHSLPHSPPLSRLKFGFAIPLYDIDVDELLVALHGFPIHDLVIDGLAEGKPTLIENISQRLPNINSLTLFRRQSSRQRISVPCRWPQPPWVYASRFSGFSNLRSFAWNLHFACEEIAPRDIVILEGSAADFEPYVLPSDDRLWCQWDDWSSVDASNIMARVFAVYNPLLEDVFIYLRSGAVKWHIEPDGSVGHLEFKLVSWNPTWEEQLDRSIIVEH
ncbi:hypothetical protein ARMSODRAFT_957325 [Armillaria solidipes]|uniref:F-box domain-containing protein n=1 Tax=Armillaria solidipes TaxID=1076256 RepID=A0A2H3BJC2_9AGAR|nr:hypothetical protein ARMSODRAFT_957325 [Armillaria solidipes]